MTTKKMTRQEEHDFYANPDNQAPQGPARRRTAKLSEPVPVRFPPETLAKIRDAAAAMTGQCRRGSGAPSTANSNKRARPPEHATPTAVLRACVTLRSGRS